MYRTLLLIASMGTLLGGCAPYATDGYVRTEVYNVPAPVYEYPAYAAPYGYSQGYYIRPAPGYYGPPPVYYRPAPVPVWRYGPPGAWRGGPPGQWQGRPGPYWRDPGDRGGWRGGPDRGPGWGDHGGHGRGRR